MPGKLQHNLILLFILLLMAGTLMGSSIIVGMSLIPFAVILAGLVISAPNDITVETEQIPPKLQLGREFDLVRTITIREGTGSVKLFQKLPEEFELVDGNNLRIIWKQKKPIQLTMTCRLRCSKRGNYVIPALQWSTRNPLSVAVNTGAGGTEFNVSVWPHLLKHRQVRQLRELALSPFPLADMSKIGVAGTDFREIRSYVRGDPIKNINWKATAHRASPGSIWPLVNEYEREGRKSVLIFLDASESVEIGSNLENVLEYSIEAASNLLYYFIDKGYRVGVAVCGEPKKYFYPDSGRQQLTRIIPQMVHLKAGGGGITLLNAIDNYWTYILNHKPLSLVVSTLDSKSSDVLGKFFDRLKGYYSRRRQPPIVLVNVIGRDLIPVSDEYNSNVSTLMELQSKPVLHQLRKSGITIMEWNPGKQSFHSVLAGQVRR